MRAQLVATLRSLVVVLAVLVAQASTTLPALGQEDSTEIEARVDTMELAGSLTESATSHLSFKSRRYVRSWTPPQPTLDSQ
jgi:hypothetical protein